MNHGFLFKPPTLGKWFAELRQDEWEVQTMITEAAILGALDKPRRLYAIQQRVLPGEKSTEELQEALMRLRNEKKVKFDIHNGQWSRV